MSKKLTREQILRQQKKEYKKSIKRLWICVLWLIPVMIGLSVLFSELKFQLWLAILLNVEHSFDLLVLLTKVFLITTPFFFSIEDPHLTQNSESASFSALHAGHIFLTINL